MSNRERTRRLTSLGSMEQQSHGGSQTSNKVTFVTFEGLPNRCELSDASLTPHSHQGPMRLIIGMVSDHYESPVATRKKRNVPWEKTVGPVGLKLDA